jgi:transcriptional regulator with XRE-family HTH domain
MNAAVTFTPEEFVIDPLWLEAALVAKDVSASSLARKMGVEVGTVSRWRRGVVPLSKSRWVAVLGVLGLPMGFSPRRDSRCPRT